MKYKRHLAASKNKKQYYAYVKSKRNKKVSTGPLKVNDELLTDSKEMADTLAKEYLSVF